MKKIIIPIIAAAILGAGAGVTAVMMNRANVATADDAVDEEVEVKSGNYYLNGDVDSGLWIEVTPETISLKGDDVDSMMRAAIAEDYAGETEDVVEEVIQDQLEKDKLLYCEEKPYYAYVVNLTRTRCIIKVDRNNRPVENREDLRNTNAGFSYNDTTDTIHLSLFGDFTLVE